MKRDHGWTKANIPLQEVIDQTAKMELEYASRWVTVGAKSDAVTKVKDVVKSGAAQFAVDKASRWNRLGIGIAAFGYFNLLTSNARVMAKMRNLDPETAGPFRDFMTAYSAALQQNVEIGRVKRPVGEVLTREFGNFARSIELNDEAVQKVEIALTAWTSVHLQE